MTTGINYLDETWSPITGCSGQGCKCRDNCWARDMVRRFPAIHGWDEDTPYRYVRGESSVQCAPLPFSTVQFHPDRLGKPLHWRKPRRIGVCFMGDLFDEQVRDSWLYSIYPVMVEADWHTYFVLTKQVKRMAQWISNTKTAWKNRTSHIWHGISICDQEDADRMMPELLRIPGKHWVSWEPALGPVDFVRCRAIERDTVGDTTPGAGESFTRGCIDFLVIGSESGKNRRPCPHEWMIDVAEQCQRADIPVWVKQIDLNGKVCHDIKQFPKELQVRELC